MTTTEPAQTTEATSGDCFHNYTLLGMERDGRLQPQHKTSTNPRQDDAIRQTRRSNAMTP
jgi:hypothetical protein